MKSFPSTLNKGGRYIKNSAFNKSMLEDYSSGISGLQLDDSEIKYNVDRDVKALNTLNMSELPNVNGSPTALGNHPKGFASIRDTVYGYEDPLKAKLPSMGSMNTYHTPLGKDLKILVEHGRDENNDEYIHAAKIPVVRSIFNPYYALSVRGMQNNIPMITGSNKNGTNSVIDTSDCSISKLVQLCSNGGLGLQVYRFADFMYCNELGKISNNHLITLRRFAHPIGDDITTDSGDDQNSPDIGHLVTWFGTEDNKIENILTYSMNIKFQERTSKIEEVNSRENDQNQGFLGKLLHTIDPNNAKIAEAGFPAANNLITDVAGKFFPSLKNGGYGDFQAFTRYDKNRIYEPHNTVRDTHLYDGQLTFKQSIEVTFKYKLRAYDDINPRSAFLDLLGNILAVTYNRGSFWGGSRRWIGPTSNFSGWQKANALLKNAYNRIEGTAKAIAGGFGDGKATEAFLGEATKYLQDGKQMVNKIKDMIINGDVSTMLESITKNNLVPTLKGLINNAIGRPSLYMMDSLLSGDNVGLWHLTIGNPRKPIASIGNLIMEDATLTHSGPLGIDDFPTEITLKVRLKPGRSRDIVDIEKMYTQGKRSIYYSMATSQIQGLMSMNTARVPDIASAVAQCQKNEAEALKENGVNVVYNSKGFNPFREFGTNNFDMINANANEGG